MLGQLEELLVGGAVAGRGAHSDLLAVPDAQPAVDQVFSGPREYSSGALIRSPSGDQPSAGGNIRRTTGPSSSAQITVESADGAV
jgi:hypothetical protein